MNEEQFVEQLRSMNDRLDEVLKTERPLDGIDVRAHEDESSGVAKPTGKIEFAVFCEGEYVESCVVSMPAALELFVTLSKLLGLKT